MNVFEDLIGELKEQNLLEETVIEKNPIPISSQPPPPPSPLSPRPQTTPNKTQPTRGETEIRPAPNPSTAAAGSVLDFGLVDAGPSSKPSSISSAETSSADSAAGGFDFFPSTADSALSAELNQQTAKPLVDEMEFYRRRAVEEVTSLQMVEHVFSGVEREQMRILPKPFNDIAVKKALHDFLQMSKNSTASENAQAEFKLMQETESWCSALSHRDRHLSVSALRRFCESAKPPLSSQALIALARFYRNLPHTEAVRSKFDMVVTRLFTKDAPQNRREMVFDRVELVKQIEELYADWASVPLYSVEAETELLLTSVKFDDFLAEAQGAENFDELVKKDFYNRLRLFKESIGEKFYAPVVLATAIEINVLIGNRYVELLERERNEKSSEEIEGQYSFLLDQAISDATSKTLQLVELLKERNAVLNAALPVDKTKEKLHVPEVKIEYKSASARSWRGGLFGVSWWLVAALLLVILSTAGLFAYAEFFSPQIPSASVQKVNLENSIFKDYLQAARINDQIFYGVVNASWDTMSSEKKQEILGNLLNVGKEKGFSKVQLLNSGGLTIGHASDTEIVVHK